MALAQDERRDRPALDADAALQDMKQATQRLDEILQHMCAAAADSPTDADKREDDEFVDASEHVGGQKDNNADNDDNPSREELHAGYASIQDYFRAIESALTAAVDHASALRLTTEPWCGDEINSIRSDTSTLPELERDRFARLTRHVAFHFATAEAAEWTANTQRERVSAAELDANVPLEHFVARLRSQLDAQDQLLPASKAAALVDRVTRVVIAQNATTLHAMRSFFHERAVNDNQVGGVHWQQGSNQVAQICVKEAECGYQWGLQVLVTIESLFRVQSKQQSDEILEGPLVSATLQHSLFLAKSEYDAEDADAAIASTASDQFQRELPELLKVYVRGGFHDEASSAASASEQHQAFTKLSIHTAACSRFHALLLNDLGMVFAFGLSVDGALGMGFEGTHRAVRSPRLLTFFFDGLITIRNIACGGDPMAGAHSAAVTTDGSVYTWGAGVALGNRSIRSHAEPQLIQLPPIEDADGEVSNATAPAIQSVSCGGGFCIALAETGHVFAWGKWSDGRLGLGRIPILSQSSRKYGRRRQFQSFQLSPKQLTGSGGGSSTASQRSSDAWLLAKVSCGEAHCVGLTRDGEIVTWGRGSHGQLGHGTARDALAPMQIAIASERRSRWRDVAAGENWSMALDEHGQVWTWGGCGSAVLGQGNGSSIRKTAVVTEMILQRHFRLLKQQQQQSVMAPNGSEMVAPPLPQLNWMRPQLVPSFGNGGIPIQKLSAGLQHAAAVSLDGDLYLWGEGNGFSSLPNLVRSADPDQSDGSNSEGSMETEIGSEIVEHVVCGGDLVIMFTSGSFLARSMQSLYQQCTLLSGEHESLDRSEYHQVTAHLGTDIVLLASGKRLFAHKLLLARRSDVLRDLILNEQRSNATPPPPQSSLGKGEELSADTAIMELLIPQLRYDVAKVLLEFIYTDNFSLMLDPQSYLIRDVLRAAQLYRLQSLEKLCRDSLAEAASSASLLGGTAAVFPLDGLDAGSQHGERNLNVDLQFAFGDSAWSDLTLLVEGEREIDVHRCVLVARSEYFRALLGFQRKLDCQQQLRSSSSKQVVEVDESHAAMLRVLNFIYNDHVALPTAPHGHSQRLPGAGDDSSDEPGDGAEQLLEDLIAADKYGLVRWKRLCEHAVRVNLANCLEVLAVADLVSASHLKQVALAFLQSNLQVVTAEPAFDRFRADFPHLLEGLFASIRQETTNEALLRSWHEAVESQLKAQREQEAREWTAKTASAASFPWLHLVLAITFATLYLFIMSKQMYEYPFVPALNLAALLGLFSALFFGWI